MAKKTTISKESQKRYKAFEKRINEMDIDDLDLTVALGSIRLDKYMCSQCRERTDCPPFKLRVIKKGNEFCSEYCFCSVECIVEWTKEFMQQLGHDLSGCSYESNEENDN